MLKGFFFLKGEKKQMIREMRHWKNVGSNNTFVKLKLLPCETEKSP